MDTTTSPLHAATGVGLLASTAVGIGVSRQRLDLGGRRWIHHALFGTTVALAAAATLVDGRARRPTWPASLATVGILAVLPSTRGGTARHTVVATAASSAYALATTVAAIAVRRDADMSS